MNKLLAVWILSVAGLLLLGILAIGLGLFAIVPAVWPWQWNRGQQEAQITSMNS